MIESFGSQATKDVFLAKVTRDSRSIPISLHEVIRRKLAMMDAAASIADLRVPPGNQLKKLEGLKDVWAIRVNDQYRITFKFAGGNATDVLCTDYH